MNTLDQLIKSISKLPGLGKKSASRIAYWMLKTDTTYLQNLSDQIRNLKQLIKTCPVCGNYTEEIPCSICSDPTRDQSLICIVEQSQDVHTIEATREFHGLYHVLQGVLNPLEGVGPENLTIGKLLDRLGKTTIKEVIIATNPTVEGDTTALFIGKLLKERGIPVSRLASGLPVGGDLEYADRLTLARSLRGRTSFD